MGVRLTHYNVTRTMKTFPLSEDRSIPYSKASFQKQLQLDVMLSEVVNTLSEGCEWARESVCFHSLEIISFFAS